MARSLQHLLNRELSRSYTAWVDVSDQAFRSLQFLLTTRNRFVSRRLRFWLKHWSSKASIAARESEVVRRCTARVKTGRSLQAWRAWVSFLRLRSDAAAALFDAVSCMMRRQYVSCWRTWASSTCACKTTIDTLHTASYHRACRKLRIGFTHWSHRYEDALIQLRGYDGVELLGPFEILRAQRMWRAFAKKRKRETYALRRGAGHFQNCLLSEALRHWRWVMRQPQPRAAVKSHHQIGVWGGQPPLFERDTWKTKVERAKEQRDHTRITEVVTQRAESRKERIARRSFAPMGSPLSTSLVTVQNSPPSISQGKLTSPKVMQQHQRPVNTSPGERARSRSLSLRQFTHGPSQTLTSTALPRGNALSSEVPSRSPRAVPLRFV